MALHLLAVLQLAAHIHQKVGTLEADNPEVGNLAVLQVGHTLDVAGIPHVLVEDSLALAASLNTVEDNLVVQAVDNLPVGQLVGKTSQLLMILLNQLMFYFCDLI